MRNKIDGRRAKKINTPCIICSKPHLCRGYCSACYARLIRQGVIKTLEKPKVPNSLTEIQKSVMTGLMLGDGCLYRHTPTSNAYLAVTRTATDKDYLLWQADIFKEFLSRDPEYKETFDERTRKTYNSWRFVTRRCEVMTKLYEKWYPGGKKSIPDDLELDPLSIAIWFGDDGNIRNSCAKWRFKVKLSTDGFKKEEVDKLRDMLNNRYSVNLRSQERAPNQYSIEGSTTESKALIREIDSVLPKSISRKAIWRDPECLINYDLPTQINDIEQFKKEVGFYE